MIRCLALGSPGTTVGQMLRSSAAVALCAATVALAACGTTSASGSSTTSVASSTAPAQSSAPASATPTTPSPVTTGTTATVDGVTVSGPANAQPTITVTPGQPAPTTLVSQDLIVGSGPEIKAGGSGTFQYVGALFATGQVFDSSWSRGQPISFSLGQVIPGWQQGIVGMKEGGRRLLIIPPELAYGARAQARIPANSTLIFVVDLVKVK